MALLGIGSKIGYSTDGSTFTDVVEVKSISVPGGTHDTIENIHLGITDNTKQFLMGMADPGEIGFKANFTASLYSAMFAIKGLLKSGTNDIKWKITGPDPDGAGAAVPQTYTYKGALIGMDMELTPEGIIELDCKVKVSGGVVVA